MGATDNVGAAESATDAEAGSVIGVVGISDLVIPGAGLGLCPDVPAKSDVKNITIPVPMSIFVTAGCVLKYSINLFIAVSHQHDAQVHKIGKSYSVIVKFLRLNIPVVG